MGAVEVPRHAWWGAQTQRAIDAYPVSGRRMPPRLIAALALVKHACAGVNADLGLLEPRLAEAIQHAAGQVQRGEYADAFPLDVFQTGSGTATNMNMNEVLGNLASVRLGGSLGSRSPVHPNDHVNLGQSSNDTFPSAIHIAGAVAIEDQLLPALWTLRERLAERARAFQGVVKSGRTHLMDATPIRLEQEVGGWARQVELSHARATRARNALLELPLGGTAVGTGLNSHPELAPRAIARIAGATGLAFVEAGDHFEAQGARDGVVEAHGQLEAVATALFKVASDLRLLASGPRTGLGELKLPALAPGSSIMPGKVNPVMCEMLTQVCVRVLGNGTTIKTAGMSGQLQLNVFLPVMAEALLDSIMLLARGCVVFADKAIAGLEADAARCRATVERNLSLGTALVPSLGYDKAAEIAKAAHAADRSVRQELEARGLLDDDVEALLDPARMT